MNTIEVKFGAISSFFDEVVKDEVLVHSKIVRVELVDILSDVHAALPYQRPTAIVVTAVVGPYIYRCDINVCQKTGSTESSDEPQEKIKKTLDHLRQCVSDRGFEPRSGIFAGLAQEGRRC